jgi:hypothetical protein
VNVDEMDLAGQALEVTPWQPEAYERARATLHAAMAESGALTEAAPVPAAAPLRGSGSSLAGHRRRRTVGTKGKVGIGAGIGAIAAAAAVILLASSTPQPAPSAARPATPAKSSSKPSGPSTGSTNAHQQPLVTLAAYLAAEPAPKGDATLVERETGQARITVWDLYADDGRYFFSRTEAGLPAQVKGNNSQGGGWAGREVAAAIYAIKGNLETAKLKMAWPYPTPAPKFSSALLLDDDVWENCEDALIAGSGNPQVRAGVLRLVSALPGITVTDGTLDRQPTLTLTAGAAVLGHDTTGRAAKLDPDAGPANQEAITINADTGIALQIAGGTVGHVTVGIRYVVTRVNLADIAAGKL